MLGKTHNLGGGQDVGSLEEKRVLLISSVCPDLCYIWPPRPSTFSLRRRHRPHPTPSCASSCLSPSFFNLITIAPRALDKSSEICVQRVQYILKHPPKLSFPRESLVLTPQVSDGRSYNGTVILSEPATSPSRTDHLTGQLASQNPGYRPELPTRCVAFP